MWIQRRNNDTIVTCKVHPNASRSCMEGIKEGHLEIRLNAPPVEGKANKALIKLMSKCLKLAKSEISIIHGEKTRIKIISIKDKTPTDVIRALGLDHIEPVYRDQWTGVRRNQ
ncbi:MAG: YggU family protein [Deltaproteobacteria bacterium]|nr:YggU family protein [Deltaproteobacteria bacterium]